MNNKKGANKNTKTVIKWFWLWQDDRYEEWLTGMSKEGWHLTSVDYYPGIRFHFKKGEPKNYNYRLDYKNTSDKDLKDYLEIFKCAGWEYIGRDIAWKYFRKEVSLGEADDIYSDNCSKIQKYKNIINLLLLLGALEFIVTINSMVSFLYLLLKADEVRISMLVMSAITFAFVPLVGYGIYKIKKRIRELSC